jgi:uncharacterized protein (TIGR02466 family)
MNYNIQPIFPSAILNANIGRELTDDEINFAKELSGLIKESEGNYQTVNHKVLDAPQFADINNFISGAIKEYVSNVIVPRERYEIYITQSWLNYTPPGQYHHKHNHPNSILSGVFYFNAEKTADHIQFEHKDYDRLYLVSKRANIYNAKTVTVDVSTGDLIIFPSEIPHHVPKTSSSDTRVSLAFNTFVRGEFGTDDSLTHLFL